MDEICRLCLSISKGTMHKLCQESEILCKIFSCFSVKITLNCHFPDNICDACRNKINETHDFKKKVLQNEQKLTSYLKNADYMESLYEFIKNGNEIKVEKEIVHEKIYSENNTKYEEIHSMDINETNYSSDEEVTLSSLKKEQETSSVKLKNKLKYPITHVLNDIKTVDTGKFNRLTCLIYKTQNDRINQNDVLNDIKTVDTTQFTCLTCHVKYNTQSDLIKHYSTEHNKKKKEEEYTMESLNSKMTYKCRKCDKVYEEKKLITRHVITHQCERPFICSICGRTYKTVAEIVRHGRVHNGSKLLCPQNCGYSTVYRGALKEHIKRHSNKVKFKYSCDKCGKRFNVKTWHDQHQNVHTGLKPFVCDLCGLAFHMHRYLTSHRSAVHPQSSSVKRYVCTHCHLPCDTRNTLTVHMEIHGIKASFLCDTCGKVLSSAEQLKHHKRVHLGIKPYSCSVCSKSFTKKFNLTTHERTHTGERAHVCNKCGKSYTQRSALFRHHRRSHPVSHKCSTCDKCFASRSQLDTHQKLCL